MVRNAVAVGVSSLVWRYRTAAVQSGYGQLARIPRCCVSFGYEPGGSGDSRLLLYALRLFVVKLPVFALKFMGFQSNENGYLNFVTTVAYVPRVAEIGGYAVRG